MKKLLLSPLLLLASCAPTMMEKGPLSPGNVITMTGTTKGKEAVSVTFTVRGTGQRDRDGDWNYDADGAQADSGAITVSGEEDYVFVMDMANVFDKADGKMVACFARASGPGWRLATGYLLQETLAGMKTLGERLRNQPRAEGVSAFLENAGECQIIRK